jgi:hypothetical protein
LIFGSLSSQLTHVLPRDDSQRSLFLTLTRSVMADAAHCAGVVAQYAEQG